MTDQTMTPEQALEWLEGLRNTTGDQVCAEIEAGKAAEAAQAFRAALEAARRNAGMLAPPEGYALISVEVLRAWGKLDELRECCRYPKHATSQPAAVDEARSVSSIMDGAVAFVEALAAQQQGGAE